MEKIKVGVIGVGHLGKYHAQKYADMEDVALVGVADVDSNAAREVAEVCSTKMFTGYKQLLKEVDAVSIVVPTSLHHEVALICLDNDLDLLIEKPITTTLAEADALLAKAKERNRIIQVGHIERYNPAVICMEKYLTKPVFIESQRVHEFTPRGTDVDVVLDLMIHDIDIILSIVDSPLESIHTVGVPVVMPSNDVVSAQLIFKNGCTANVTVNRIAKVNRRELRIFQAKSSIAVNYSKKEITVFKRQNELTPEGYLQEDKNTFCFTEHDALEHELKDFIKSVRTRETPKVPGEAGRKALDVALQIMEKLHVRRLNHKDLLKC